MASLITVASCLVIETATSWSTNSSSSPHTSLLYKSTRRLRAAKQLPSVIGKPWRSSSSLSSAENNEQLISEMYLLLEAVSDRVEMHKNVGEQRNNWNTLLLSSINMMTLTATAITGLAATCDESQIMGLNMSSFVLFIAATGMLVIMNTIQPSQLAEEQRNATRLFKRIEHEIRTLIAIGKPITKEDVERLMEKILVLDRAYPLALLGAMIEKFPSEFEPARWWPDEEIIINTSSRHAAAGCSTETGLLDTADQLSAIVQLLKVKDMEDYDRLGNIALKLNKRLAVSGPALSGIAALASAFASNQSTMTAAVAVGKVYV